MFQPGSVATTASWPWTREGRGETDWAPRGDYSTDAFVADIEEFCYTLGIEKMTLVGHSMGGRNSIAFAGRNAAMLEKLVIVDIGPDIQPEGSARITEELVNVPQEFDSYDAQFEYMDQQNRFASEPVLRRRLRYASKELTDGRIGWRYDPEIRAQRRDGTGAPPPDLWAPLPNITCPTLVVRGSETDTLSLDVAERMVEALPTGSWRTWITPPTWSSRTTPKGSTRYSPISWGREVTWPPERGPSR